MVAPAAAIAPSVESIIARLERLPISRELTVARIVIGSATFFDAYTVLAIAYAMPVLAQEWNLTPGQIGAIISAGKGTAAEKIQSMERAGIRVAKSPATIGETVISTLGVKV